MNEREKELNKLVNKFNMNTTDSNKDCKLYFNENQIKPLAIFSNNFKVEYDTEMNDELRNLAKQTREIDNINTNNITSSNKINNNIILNQSLRNQILNNITTNLSTETNKSNGNKMAGKIYISRK